MKKDRETSDKKKSDFKAGKMFGVSGRDLFQFNPDLVAGDDDEAEDIAYEQEPDAETANPVSTASPLYLVNK